MRRAEIYNLAKRFLLTIDDIGPLSNAHLGETGHSSNDVLWIVDEEIAQTDRTSVNVLVRDERHNPRLNRFRESHRDVTVGCVIVAGDVSHSDGVVDDSEDLLVSEAGTKSDVRILLQKNARVLTFRAPFEPVTPHLRLNPASPEGVTRDGVVLSELRIAIVVVTDVSVVVRVLNGLEETPSRRSPWHRDPGSGLFTRLDASISELRVGPSKLLLRSHLQITVMDDDGNSLRVIVIEELALTLVIGLSSTLAADGLVVLPGRPTPLDEENVSLGESSVIVLDARVWLIITTLLHLNNSMSVTMHLVHEIDSTTTIVVRSVRNCLLLEWGHETPE